MLPRSASGGARLFYAWRNAAGRRPKPAGEVIKAQRDCHDPAPARMSNGSCPPLHENLQMNAIKEARKLIARDPFADSAKTLVDLVLSLESKVSFPLERLYELDMDTFDLAVEILKEWRLDRYFAGKAKLFDFAVQLRESAGAQTAPEAPAPEKE
jgi:hypothetical protein